MRWPPKSNILVPVDFSAISFGAMKLGARMVTRSSSLQVIHVLPQLSPMEPGVIWGEIDDVSRAEHARKALRKKMKAARYKGAKIAIVFGDPAHEIARHAKSINASMIVISSHGRTGAAHLLIGSTAERVVRFAHCPVLVLRD